MTVATQPVNTKKVKCRRAVRYGSLNDVLADAERLASCEVKTLGNWSAGQNYEHLARSLDNCIDGDQLFPAPMRWVLRLFFKKKFLNVAIPAGFNSPSKLVAENPVSTEDGLASLRKAIER